MPRKRKEPEIVGGPGGSDMALAEAFKRVLYMAETSPVNDHKRDEEAIKLIRSLAVGSYSLRETKV